MTGGERAAAAPREYGVPRGHAHPVPPHHAGGQEVPQHQGGALARAGGSGSSSSSSSSPGSCSSPLTPTPPPAGTPSPPPPRQRDAGGEEIRAEFRAHAGLTDAEAVRREAEVGYRSLDQLRVYAGLSKEPSDDWAVSLKGPCD